MLIKAGLPNAMHGFHISHKRILKNLGRSAGRGVGLHSEVNYHALYLTVVLSRLESVIAVCPIVKTVCQ